MNDQSAPSIPFIPQAALDERGVLLSPDRIPLDVLIAASEAHRFAESVAELAQTAAAAVLHDPAQARALFPAGGIQIVRAPICKALSKVKDGALPRCVRDIHAAGHAAMAAGKPIAADCVAGTTMLYACPITLTHGGTRYPKAAVVAAAQDTYNFHFADRLARVLGDPASEVEDLLCQTEKRCLNAAQLRLLRAIMDTQTQSYSQQITDRYAQFESGMTILRQKQEIGLAYEQLDSECRKVGEIQLGLVPKAEPDLEAFGLATYYKPAHRAGGDYFDFFPQSDGSCGVLVADVSGHGPGAAVIMAMMRALLKACPERLRSPGELLEYANRHLCEITMSDQFVTAFFTVLDSIADTICCASAGHNPPLFFVAATGKVRQLNVEAALPLGIAGDTNYSQKQVPMNSGDVLLLYTDGIPDTQNPADDSFGLKRLSGAFRDRARDGAKAVRDGIVRHVKEFAGDRAPFDDHTLVVIKRR